MLCCLGVNTTSVFVPTYPSKDNSCLHIVLLADIGMNKQKFWNFNIFNNFIDMILIMAWQQSFDKQEIIIVNQPLK